MVSRQLYSCPLPESQRFAARPDNPSRSIGITVAASEQTAQARVNPGSRQLGAMRQKSLQLRVLRLGVLQDGDFGIGVFPEGEEILVSGAGLGVVALESVGASDAKTSESA